MNETHDDNGSSSQTVDVGIENMDFQMSLAQKPPDLNQIIDILKNLAVQVKNIQVVQASQPNIQFQNIKKMNKKNINLERLKFIEIKEN